jgi:hypothetical protein
MLAVWRKTPLPHHNRRRKTMQTKKANQSKSSLVAQLKPKPSHKEKKQKNQPKQQTTTIQSPDK